MAAFYQTGTATDTHALMNIITAFITPLGWNLIQSSPLEYISNSQSDSNGRATRYYKGPGDSGHYFMASGIEGLTVDYRNYIVGGCIEGHSDSYDYTNLPPADALADFNANGTPYSYRDQAGYAYEFTSNDIAGPYTKYHLFGGQEGVRGNYWYCVLETSAGLFSHFGMGEIDQVGNLPANFAVGTYWNMSTNRWRSLGSNYHQRMFDSHNSYYGGRGHISCHQSTVAPVGECYSFGASNDHVWGGSIGGSGGQSGGLNECFISDNPNAMNARVMLQPNHILLDDQLSWKRIIGVAPAFRTLRLDHLQTEDIVDTDWMVFPIKARNAATGPTSGVYGWAYKFQ